MVKHKKIIGKIKKILSPKRKRVISGGVIKKNGKEEIPFIMENIKKTKKIEKKLKNLEQSIKNDISMKEYIKGKIKEEKKRLAETRKERKEKIKKNISILSNTDEIKKNVLYIIRLNAIVKERTRDIGWQKIELKNLKLELSSNITPRTPRNETPRTPRAKIKMRSIKFKSNSSMF